MSKLENALHKACTLIYFDSNKTTVINTDNSLVDISPVLTQEGHVIQFTNQVFTPIELRYEQFETVTNTGHVNTSTFIFCHTIYCLHCSQITGNSF